MIKSFRHKLVDIDLWKALEETDRLCNIDRREAEAINAICEFIVRVPNCYVGTSWGKDSIVVAHLLWCIDKSIPLHHMCPTNRSKDCDLVRDAYFYRFPGQSYSETIVDYSGVDRRNMPHQQLDKETDRIWNKAIRDHAKDYDGHILGIRAEESMGRNIRMMRWGLNSPHASAPIGRWSTADVFAYLAKYDLPVHPAYACLGGGRWERDRLRVAEIGDTHGTGGGRREWEEEYYGSELRRAEV